MALGRLIERLFVQVRADLSQLSGDLAGGVADTQQATQKMARLWEGVSSSIENLTADLQKGLITQSQYMSQLNRHSSQIAKLGGNYRMAQKQVHGYAASLRAAQVAAVNPGWGRGRKKIDAFGRSAGMARMQVMNLGFQVNDVGQTLATGMNPLTVLIQQGSQILQIYAGQGGVKAAFSDISKILVNIGKRIWPIAVVLGGFKLLQREINKTSEVSVSFGDTFKAVFQVLWRRVSGLIDGPLQWLQDKFGKIFDFIAKWFPPIMDGMINAVRIMVKGVSIAINVIPGLFRKAWENAKKWVFWSLSDMVGGVAKMLESVAQGLNDVFGTDLSGPTGLFDISADLNRMGSDAAVAADGIESLSEAWDRFKGEANTIWNSSPIGELFEEIRVQAIENATNRISKGVDDIGNSAADAGNKVKELADKLDQQLTTAADNMAQVFGNAFERLAETGKFTFSEFVKDMNRLIIRSTSQILQQELSNLFKTLAKSRGGVGSWLSNLGTMIFGGGIPGRARGGVQMPWQDFVAGEEGPEIIKQDGPAGARRIQTAGQSAASMRRASSPMQVTINQYIQTPNPDSFRKSQSQIASRASRFLTNGRRNQ